jgi:hypothetical protein
MIQLSNHNKPTNPVTVKMFALVTIITMFAPDWFNSIPGITEVAQLWFTWSLKGLNLLAMLIAVFTNGGYKPPVKKI